MDEAWSIFIDERCTLVRVYNRLYSNLRLDPTIADPAEPPIDPTLYGCQ